MLLEGKTVIVTGGNSGIGEGIVLEAASHGANVVIDYVTDAEHAKELASQIVADGGHAIAVEANVAVVADLERLIATAVETFGRLDVMVNNAGIESGQSLLETTEETFDLVQAVNLKGAVFGTKLAAQQFIAQGGEGVVVNISSTHEDWPMPGDVAYCASKGGMRMLTRTAGVELAEHGVRIVNVGPGAIATPINAEDLDDPASVAALKAAIPMGRIGTPEDVARTVVFVASDKASYMTATTVFVDGALMHASSGV